MSKHRVNIGCGMTPTQGWLNFDNSLSVRLAACPVLVRLLGLMRLLGDEQRGYISFCRKHDIAWSDATRHVPLKDASAEVVYSSHVLEHLDRNGAKAFLCEIRRLLVPGGRVRIAVPDLQIMIDDYNSHGDADRLIADTLLAQPQARSWGARIKAMIIGPRHHLWMYDGKSLANLLSRSGFDDVRIMASGETGIANPGELDLNERAAESVYVEAVRP
ncbi:MAG: methyltransferase domain-containing protein [Rhodospirillales bacterium]|nr:methyltransferase domain-containing protein [Rhodospirillales bacterium]